jgi:glucosylceramidase
MVIPMIQPYLTCKDTDDRLTAQAAVEFGTCPEYSVPSVCVDTARQYQTIEGFGGAFTEATATTFYKMPPAVQAEILRAYFDPQAGHGYTVCRTHINSCDFSLGNYAYDEVDGDYALEHFTIERDRTALIPLIKSALRVAGEIKLFASPWSPPAWMKSTGIMNWGGTLKPECRQAWADYYIRYIRAYAAEGIPIWGLTVQNEPEATQSWDSCIYTGEDECAFVRDYLGPTLHAAGLADVKLMIWDHNRDRMYERAKAVFDDPAAARYVWGTGFHWYCGDHFDNVQRVHDAWPDKALVFTEGCQEWGTHIGSWEVGERYGRSMINDLNRWTVAWTDWNMVLDETGGPNHVNNLCSAPIIANTQDGTLYYHSSYWYIGHFARFLRPGARRVLCAPTLDDLDATAAVNPDGTVAVVVMNRTDAEITFALKYADRAAMVTLPGRAIVTYTFPG